MSTNPIFVFIPGAWHPAECFDQVRTLLTAQGYESEAIATPSVDAKSPDTGLHADIQHAHSVIEGLANSGRQIVVVNHSYGGIVGAGAVEGLGYKQRSASGESGGVIMAIWMCAFVAPKGKSLFNMLGNEFTGWMIANNEEGYACSSQQETIFYHDIPEAEQKKWIGKLRKQPLKAFFEPATHEPWRDIPAMYMYCDQDQALPIEAQGVFASNLGEHIAFHIDASHSPFLSKPEEVVSGLEIGLKEGLARIEVL